MAVGGARTSADITSADIMRGEDGGAGTKERIAYLRGLLQGCDFTGVGADRRQLWDGLLEVVDGLVRDTGTLRASIEEQDEYIDAMDEALWNVEERLDVEDDDVVVDLEDGKIAVECPNCSEEFLLRQESMSAQGETRCPECGSAVALRSVGEDGELRAVFSSPGFPAAFQDDHKGNGSAQADPPPQPS